MPPVNSHGSVGIGAAFPIGLALAVLAGTAGEPAAPASSILWPLILVPLVQLPGANWWPLVISLAAAFGSLAIFRRVLGAAGFEDGQPLQWLLLVLLILGALGMGVCGAFV